MPVCSASVRSMACQEGRGVDDACGPAGGLPAVGQGILLSASCCATTSALHSGRSSSFLHQQWVSFPTQRISIVLTFAVSTSLALFPWVVSQAYPTPNPPAKLSCLLQAKRVQQELNQPCFKSPGTHPIGVLTPPLAAKYFV